MEGIIYKVTNKINGKVYIGQTIISLDIRRNSHIYNAINNKDNFHFHKAIKLYGKDNFVWEIIEYCNSKEELNEMEFHYIKQYNSFEEGYNMTMGGGSLCGFKHSDISKQKISNTKRGKKLPHRSKEWCRNISNSKKGTKLQLDTILKRQHSRKYATGIDNKLSKKYIVTYPNGEEVIVHGLKLFCKSNSFYKALSAVATGKRTHHKGYKCRYLQGDNYNG